MYECILLIVSRVMYSFLGVSMYNSSFQRVEALKSSFDSWKGRVTLETMG